MYLNYLNKFKNCGNQRGIAIVAVIVAMLLLAFFGQSIVYMMGTSQATLDNQSGLQAAFYESQAGLEYGLKKAAAGQAAAVTMNFGNGSFVVTEDAATITSVGRSGAAEVAQTVDKANREQKDCINLDVSNARVGGSNLNFVRMNKTCLAQVVLDKIILSWVPDNGEKLRRIRIELAVVYDDLVGVLSGALLDIADYTIADAAIKDFNEIRFDSQMRNKTFTMTLVMGDGSLTVPKTFTP